MSLEFFGFGTHSMSEGRISIKRYTHGDDISNHRLLVLRWEDRTLRIVPYSRDVDDFFRSLPYDDIVRLAHYERISVSGEDQNHHPEGSDASRVLMRTTDSQGRLYFDKRIPDQTPVELRGYSAYLEMKFPEAIDKLLEKRE